jgi:hypothetical protein
MSPVITSLGSGSARGFGRALKAFIRKPSITSPANNATNQSSSSLSFTASSFQIVGKATSHSKSDWQIASDSGFSNIVVSITNDTTNKTTWTVTSGLSLNTTYYARVRYKDSSTLISDWSSTITFGIEGYLPSLTNGTSDITVATAGSYNWTVPARVGRIKVQIIGSGGGETSSGGYVDVSFDVTPGQVFTFAKTAMNTERITFPKCLGGLATAFWLSDGTTNITQAKIWTIVGGGGGATGDGGPPSGYGGNGGGDTAGAGYNSGYWGTAYLSGGGTQSSGGVAQLGPGSYDSGNSIDYYNMWNPTYGALAATHGTAINGGLAAKQDSGRDSTTGAGGNGWYGGCGGVRWYACQSYRYEDDDGWHTGYSCVGTTSGGGGGSSRIQIPSGKNTTITTNQTGSSGAPSLSTGIKITY